MSAHGFNRGHRIVFDATVDVWRYADTLQAVPENPHRRCGCCALANRPDGHDACLGAVIGVANACCGHGAEDNAYVAFDDGKRIGGRRALEALSALPRKDAHVV